MSIESYRITGGSKDKRAENDFYATNPVALFRLFNEYKFNKYPPKYIYVFRNRMSTWRDGNECDEKGKKWTTTICHAWFVWEKGSKTEPIIRWL